MTTTHAGKTVKIHYDEHRCSHAGECVAALPAVFRFGETPAIDPDAAAPGEIRAAVARCPSGALAVEMTDLPNGIDVQALAQFSQAVAEVPARGVVSFGVETRWLGGTHSVAKATTMILGDTAVPRRFEIAADEPESLLGRDTAANPQELLLAAMNACMTVGYIANAAAMGIIVRDFRIAARGSLDLRGFLGIDPEINPGYDEIEYDVTIDSDASEEAIDRLHRMVQATSPNFHNMARAIRMKATINGRA